ncbi:DUF6509 family protein [Paenibacillus sp. CAU 1782]
MFSITEYSVEKMKDPFGILTGERYELLLSLEVEEDDELYHEEGVSLRVVFLKDGDRQEIAKYEFQTTTTGSYIDMEMEEDELAAVSDFCRGQVSELEGASQ